MGTSDARTIIRGARIVDGTGNPWFYGDLVLAGSRIAEIAPAGSISQPGAIVVDGTGLVACPGFIDIQSHSIVTFMTDRRSVSKITQGVTTEIMGEAWTPSPFGGKITDPFRDFSTSDDVNHDEWLALSMTWTRFGDWLRWLEAEGVSVNVGSFIGDGTVREWGKGLAMGPAAITELESMQRMLASAMRDGAFGLATALIYPPGSYASTEEIMALCHVVAERHGVHITHMRSEESRLYEGLTETLEIARQTGVATEIYHLKAAGRSNWGKMPGVIDRITAARAAGVDITATMYPYVAAGTGIATCLPPWAAADGKLFENLENPEIRARIRRAMVEPATDWENLGASAGPEGVILAGLRQPGFLSYRGRSLANVAAERGEEWPDTIIELLIAERRNIFCYYFDMSEENLRLQMRQPWITFSTDAAGVDPATRKESGWLHPRAFGTYPRILGHYVREEGVIPLEEAIRKMTSAVANRLSIRDRGLLRSGMAADVVLFDPATVSDRATFDNPHQLAQGVRDVWVNGVRVLRDGTHTCKTPGKWLKGAGPTSA